MPAFAAVSPSKSTHKTLKLAWTLGSLPETPYLGIKELQVEVQVGRKVTAPACFLKVWFLRVANICHRGFTSISSRLVEGRRKISDFYRLERPVKTGAFVDRLGLLDKNRDWCPWEAIQKSLLKGRSWIADANISPSIVKLLAVVTLTMKLLVLLKRYLQRFLYT